MSRKSVGYIPTLDGWRAIAIAGVILSHSFPSTYWTRSGALGVNLFFAISGYLITTRLLDEEWLNGRVSLAKFYARRAFRILPPAIVYLSAMALLAAVGIINSSGTDFVSCLLFVRNYWGADAHSGWYTGHFWSLAVEEQFYLFWPVLLAAAGIKRARWLAPALAAAFCLWRSMDLRHAWVATFFHAENLRNNSLRSDYRMDALLWGCTLALIAYQADLTRFIPRRMASWIAIGGVTLTIALNVLRPQFYMGAQSIILPIVLIATIAQPACLLGRLLETRVMIWVGRLSYSLYLWQQPFVSQYHHGALQWFPLNLALAVSCACFSFYFVERPLIRLGQRLMRRSAFVPVTPPADIALAATQ